MFFDGARSKVGSRAGMVFIAPSRERLKFSFRLTWLCINNIIEYEAIYLGLEQAHKMKIKNLMVFEDSELVVN